VTLATYRDVDPVLTVGGIAAYFGVDRQLAAKWARESRDFPEPFAHPPAGAVYATQDVIAWGERHERRRSEGPRPAGDPRPPSARRRRKAAV
jgi:hypothetical protein